MAIAADFVVVAIAAGPFGALAHVLPESCTLDASGSSMRNTRAGRVSVAVMASLLAMLQATRTLSGHYKDEAEIVRQKVIASEVAKLARYLFFAVSPERAIADRLGN